jgi:thiamine pyrophosphokinase
MVGAIFLNGTIDHYEQLKQYLKAVDFTIGVDGGAQHLVHLNRTPDLLVGDFDSIDEMEQFETIEKIKLNTDKDYTDGERAIDYVIEKQFQTVYIFGAIGGRFDHVLSNIFLLDKLLKNDCQGIVVDQKNIITLIESKTRIEPEGMHYFSVIPMTEKITNVMIKGAKYEVNNETFYRTSSYGISNEFVDQTVSISFDSGKALIIKSKD